MKKGGEIVKDVGEKDGGKKDGGVKIGKDWRSVGDEVEEGGVLVVEK